MDTDHNNSSSVIITHNFTYTMKCLSVSQPFAELIISGKKRIELRSWNTKFRGEFLIHAPMSIRTQDCRRLGITHSDLVRGAIVGKAEIYDVKVYESASQISEDRNMHHAKIKFDRRRMYGFVLKSPVRFRVPIPYKGMLGFFEAKLPRITHYNSSSLDALVADIIDEEHRYRLVGHH